MRIAMVEDWKEDMERLRELVAAECRAHGKWSPEPSCWTMGPACR